VNKEKNTDKKRNKKRVGEEGRTGCKGKEE